MIYYDTPHNIELQNFACLDVGTKKTGIAHNFAMNFVALPHKTIETQSVESELILLQKHKFSYAIIGLPSAYPESDSYQYIEKFVKELQKNMPNMNFIFWDETGTSQQIRQEYKYGRKGFSKKFYQNYDAKVATIILTDFIGFINI